MPKTKLTLIICCLVCRISYGQVMQPGDSSAYIARTISYYFEQLGHNAPIYNGSAYAGYGQHIIGSPFFLADSQAIGAIFYEGVLYRNIPMGYDLVSDRLIIKNYRDNFLISLINEKIEYFIINNHVFIRGMGGKPETDAGFFERLYNGDHMVLVKRRKQVNALSLDDKEKSAFQEYNDYYIRYDNRFSRIKGLSGLLAAFGNKKGVIKKHLRDQKLKFKTDPGKTIAEAASYYDSLAN